MTAAAAREDCVALRAIVADCVEKHLYGTATFFADKLAILSQHDEADVYTLCQAFFFSGQHRRALKAIQNFASSSASTGTVGGDLGAASPKFKYLAARCLAECSEWDQCLEVLGDGEGDGEGEGISGSGRHAASALNLSERLDMQWRSGSAGLGGRRGLDIAAAMAFLRGRAYEALDNRGRAVQWYRSALQRDPFCYEALEALIQNHMLTSAEEAELFASIASALPPAAAGADARTPPRDATAAAAAEPGRFAWLHTLYECKGKKYGRLDEAQEKLARLGTDGGASDTSRGSWFQARGTGNGSGAAMGGMGGVGGVGGLASVEGGRRGASSLGTSSYVLTCKAEFLFQCCEFRQCFDITTRVLDADPYYVDCLPVHLACAVELGRKNDLFLLGHKLVEEDGESAMAWFAVGCYYMCIHQHDNAQRYFQKATTLDKHFAPAWIGYGHAFAMQDESDQAMAAYRTATRLFIGCHLPLLCLGMEYVIIAHAPNVLTPPSPSRAIAVSWIHH